MSTNVVGLAAPRSDVVPALAVRTIDETSGVMGAKEYENSRVGWTLSLPRSIVLFGIERLSATDISALASMKNVAKCDTWCELQNPANH